MATVTIDAEKATILMSRLDRVLSLKGELTIPLKHITSVTVRPEEARSWFHGLRIGTNIPGVLTAGTFYTGDGKVFYDMHDPEQTIAIELQDDSYQRVIVQVDDPEATAERINASLA
jgi:hypothetical protein